MQHTPSDLYFFNSVRSTCRTKKTTVATRHGYLKNLQVLHEHYFPWDACTCAAASNGHLDCLQYAHENGCV